jgi:hypothetical protein
MKKLFSFLFLFAMIHAFAQTHQGFEIKIVTLEGDVLKSIPYATVTIDKNKTILADEWGIVKLPKTTTEKIFVSVSVVGFENWAKEIHAKNQLIELQRLPLMLEPKNRLSPKPI